MDAICGLSGSYLAMDYNAKAASILRDYPVSNLENGFPLRKHDFLLDISDLDMTQAMALYRLGQYTPTQKADPDNALYYLNKVLDTPLCLYHTAGTHGKNDGISHTFRRRGHIMTRAKRFIILLLTFVPILPAWVFAGDDGLFRSMPSSIPRPGVLRVSTATFYSKTKINDILTTQYGVKKPRLLSSITDLELGLTRNLALIGSIPYYADLFTQEKRGYKSGAGDATAGMRFSHELPG